MSIFGYLVVLALGAAIGYTIGRYALYRTKDLDDARIWFVAIVVFDVILAAALWIFDIAALGTFSILPPLVFGVAYWFAWVSAAERSMCGCEPKKKSSKQS